MSSKKTFWIATLETRHFTFTAAGTTEAKARAAMEAGWKIHARQTSAHSFAEFEDGVNCLQLEIGKAYRDGQELSI